MHFSYFVFILYGTLMMLDADMRIGSVKDAINY